MIPAPNPQPFKTDTELDKTILDEAAEVTTSDRQRFYGHPADNHGCTADLWDAYLERRKSYCEERGETFMIDATDVCWMNILQKASRDANRRKRDNALDAAGYARNIEQIAERNGGFPE